MKCEHENCTRTATTKYKQLHPNDKWLCTYHANRFITEAYNIKYGTKVIIVDEDVRIPPDSISVNKGDEITIHRLDGMYCNGIDKDGNNIYIAAWTKVKLCT